MINLILPLLLIFANYVHAEALRPFRFVEADSFKESPGLPPSIELTLKIRCNEDVVKAIREEWTDPKSQKVSIAVGALVKEDLLNHCAGVKRKVRVSAGTSYSGREYEIVRIKK